MKKITCIFLGLALSFTLLAAPAFAEENNNNNLPDLTFLQAQIEQLKIQIEELISQIALLQQTREQVQETAAELRQTLRLTRTLQLGMRGEDVELLQKILATDSDIYPEGLVTGYFGPLTQNAVKNFQKIAGLDQVGNVGPQTMERLNQLLTEGAGKSGKVPPGLLIAPGLRKKLGLEIVEPLPGQKLPPGIARKIIGQEPIEDEDEDDVIFAVSDVEVIDITASSAKITWLTNLEADSKVWYSTEPTLVLGGDTDFEESAELVLNHEIVLTGLTENTDYYFVAGSTVDEDISDISEEMSFTTAELENGDENGDEDNDNNEED